MKKIKLLLFILLGFAINSSIFGQLDSALTISGTVDVYYRSNLNSTNNPENGGTLAPPTSFAGLPGFSLGMFNLVSSYEAGKVGFVADLVFGPRGTEAVFGSGPSQNIVNQLYGYWNINDKVTATMGNFNTFLGYEVISPAANFNYSTSYMFSYGPFSHSGLKLDFDLGRGWSLMTAVLNPTDATDFNPSAEYLGGLQLGYTKDAGGAWLNFLFDDDFLQVDLTTGWQATEAVYIGLNATSASDNFYGTALYLQVATSDDLSLGVRGEYFKDEGLGLIVEGDDEFGSVVDFTFSANYKVDNLTIIPEIRIDAFSDDLVITDAAAADVASSLSSFVLAAVYSF
jgi:hypothetical protein